MKYHAILMSAMLALAPVAAAWADPVVVDVVYLGHGQFKFKKHDYNYEALVSAIKSVYTYKHFDMVSVDMGTTVSQLDKAQVCPLRQGLQTQVQMFITVNEQKQPLFCN